MGLMSCTTLHRNKGMIGVDDNPQKARPFRVALVARDLLEEVI